MAKRFLFFIFILAFSSCSSSKLLQNQSLNNESPLISRIEGVYRNNSSLSSPSKKTITEHYKPFNVNSYKSKYPRNPDSVRISLQPSSQVRFTEYYENGKELNFDFKFKLKNDVMIINGLSNFELYGVPFIFYRHSYQILNLSNTATNDLIIASKGEYSGGILVLIFGGPITSISTFERIKE